MPRFSFRRPGPALILVGGLFGAWVFFISDNDRVGTGRVDWGAPNEGYGETPLKPAGSGEGEPLESDRESEVGHDAATKRRPLRGSGSESFVVDVRDALDKPVPGVSLFIAARDPLGGSWWEDEDLLPPPRAATSLTNAQGLWSPTDAEDLSARERRHWIVPGVLGCSAVEQAPVGQKDTRSPAIIRLPGCAPVKVEVVMSSGEPLANASGFALLAFDQIPDRWSPPIPALARHLASGEALFSHVQVGRALVGRVHVRSFGRALILDFEDLGPRATGTEHTIRVQAPDLWTFRARLVGQANRRPVSGEFRIELDSPFGRTTASGRADEQGQLACTLPFDSVPSAGDGGVTLRISVQGQGESDEHREGEVSIPAPPTPGESDLGVLVLSGVAPPTLTLLVGGQVHGLPDPLQGRLRVIVQHRSAEATAWKHVRDAQAQVDPDGSFAVRGLSSPGDWQVTANTNDLLMEAPIPFEIGDTDVQLRLHPTGDLSAVVVSQPDATVTAILRRPQEPGPGLSPAVVYDGNEARFHWRPLLPGQYDLTIFTPGGSPLIELGGIEVTAGHTTVDPRLNPLVVAGLFRSVPTHVRSHDEQSLDSWLALPEHPGVPWPRMHQHGQSTLFLAPDDVGPWWIWAEGHAAKRLEQMPDVLALSLKRGPQVRIQWDDLPTGFTSPQMHVYFTPIALDTVPEQIARHMQVVTTVDRATVPAVHLPATGTWAVTVRGTGDEGSHPLLQAGSIEARTDLTQATLRIRAPE